MGLAKEVGKRLLIYVIGGVIVCKTCEILDEWRTERRKRVPPNEKTKVNWKGNVILGTEDYQVI